MSGAKVFTYEELSQHNKEDDLWMAIDGKVYDCTKFLEEHPGGEEVMTDCGGIDATGPFDVSNQFEFRACNQQYC